MTVATIKNFRRLEQGSERPQPEASAAIVALEIAGEKFIQLNSYGSLDRQIIGARSQNMRLTNAAFEQLVEIGRKHFGEK